MFIDAPHLFSIEEISWNERKLTWVKVGIIKGGDNNHNALYRDEIVKEKKKDLHCPSITFNRWRQMPASRHSPLT